MKKVLLFLLMFTYSLSSIGMTISLHYCCGKLDGVSFSAKHDSNCAKSNEVKKSKCCNDQQVSLKINSEYQQPVQAGSFYKTFVAIPSPSPAFTSFGRQAFLINSHATGTPPPLPSIPLFIKYCIFRIWFFNSLCLANLSISQKLFYYNFNTSTNEINIHIRIS